MLSAYIYYMYIYIYTCTQCNDSIIHVYAQIVQLRVLTYLCVNVAVASCVCQLFASCVFFRVYMTS